MEAISVPQFFLLIIIKAAPTERRNHSKPLKIMSMKTQIVELLDYLYPVLAHEIQNLKELTGCNESLN